MAADRLIRVVVADDHPLFRRGLIATLTELDAVEVVGEAADGAEAVAAVAQHEPDVVLLDLGMPVLDGYEACRQVVADRPDIAVLVLTMSDDADSIAAALRAGARGYLLKGADAVSVERALRSVVAGDLIVAGSASGPVVEALTAGRAIAEAFPQLSPREREILDLLARGLGNRAIARELFLSDKTVRNQVSLILRKIDAADRDEGARRARSAGLGRG